MHCLSSQSLSSIQEAGALSITIVRIIPANSTNIIANNNNVIVVLIKRW